jgi:hypothetical protein
MKKSMLSVISSVLLSYFVFGIGSAGLFFTTLLYANQNAYAMSATEGNKEKKRNSTTKIGSNGKIHIKSKKGYFYENNMFGKTVQRSRWKNKKNEKFNKLSLEELKNKLKTKEYDERISAYLYYRMKTKAEIYVEIPLPGEDDWAKIIDEMIVDLKLALESTEMYNYKRAYVLNVLKGLGEKIVEYFEDNKLQDYTDPDIRDEIIMILTKIANNRSDLIPRVIEIIKPLEKDEVDYVRSQAKWRVKELTNFKKE